MNKYTVLTNGKRFRIRDNLKGEVVLKDASAGGLVFSVPDEFATYKQALARVAELEERDRDNIWVPVDEYK